MKIKVQYNFLIVLLAVLIYTNSFAQDFKQDLENAFSIAGCSDQIMIDLDTWKLVDGKKIESMHSILKMNENVFLYHFEGQDVLTTPTSSIIVDDVNKQIHYNRRLSSNNEVKDPFGIEKINKILESSKSIDYKGNTKFGKTYVLHTPDELISETHVVFDAETGLVKKLVHFYNENFFELEMEVHMVFNEVNLEPTFNDKDFKEKAYVQLDKKKDRIYVTPDSKFAGYEVSVHDF